MNLKNYTSTVAAASSITRIEKRLVEIGAKNINKQYEGGVLIGIQFLIDVNNNTVAFSLPAKVDTVYKVMWGEIKKPVKGTQERVRDQAERTAWKIIADWVDVQASMIYLEQAEVMQVFMPYALIRGGQTFYEAFKEKPQLLLGSGQ